jgi:hypothetical protein
VVEVNFIRTKITDAGLEHLKGLTKLETLSLDDGQDRRAGVRLQRVPDPEQMGQFGIDWTIFAINCTGFRTALS